MTKTPYTYTALRYVHDTRTGEFLNVGIVLHAAAHPTLFFRTRKTFGRVKAMFPDLNGDAFRDAMAAIDPGLAAVARHMTVTQVTQSERDAPSFARMALPADDSTLQWSPAGSGITDDPAKDLERLYARLVIRYDSVPPARRTDADVWRPVREKLQQRAIKIELEEKIVVGPTDEIAFKHAWRNAQWHAYEPLSLDLADSDGIKDKARRWRGHLDAVAGEDTEPFSLTFIVGAPQNPSLQPAYRSALAILRHAEFRPKVFEENQLDDLVNEIEDEVRAHAQIAQNEARSFLKKRTKKLF